MKRILPLFALLLVVGCSPHHYPGAQGAGQASGPGMYTVARGDTLLGIARKTGTDWHMLAEINQLQAPYRLEVGQGLKLSRAGGVSPGMPLATGPATGAPPPAPDEVHEEPLAPRSVEAAPLAPPSSTGHIAPTPGQSGSGTPTNLLSPTALVPVTIAPPAANGGSTGSGNFTWPVKGDIVSGFGAKPGGLHNDGINIAAAEGTPVKAAAAGTVAYAGDQLKGFGNLVLIRHADGWVTAYAHLASLNVRKGDSVKGGQQIGAVGHTGTIDSPQLHFEMRHEKEAIDPAMKLSG